MAGAFLIVDDDPLCSRSLARLLGCLAPTVGASSLADGRDALARGPGPLAERWAGAVVDLLLPDGLGIDLALELRGLAPPVPTLLLTGHVDRTAINDAQVAGVEFALKPPDNASLIAFAARALREPSARPQDDGALLARCVDDYGLTVRDAAVLAQALLGLNRVGAAQVLGMRRGTIKSHINSILRRTRAPSLRTLVTCLRAGKPWPIVDRDDEGEEPPDSERDATEPPAASASDAGRPPSGPGSKPGSG